MVAGSLVVNLHTLSVVVEITRDNGLVVVESQKLEAGREFSEESIADRY